MGRLIDADAMLKRLQEWNTNDELDKALYNFCARRINEQPIAYDVESVVAELEEQLLVVEIEDEHIVPESDVDEYFELDVVPMVYAREIVRKGGKKQI